MGECTSTERLTAGDATGSLVVKKITGAAGVCGAKMPLNCAGAACVSTADADKIKAWITDGAKNN